ncbi:MAG: hypothetical protein M0R51_07365 [Clostridia bacterium]|jgi:hypothetical protein|nr:hypothetical protein [Clostridia bacterium]
MSICICENCGKEFEEKPRSKRFCSQSCVISSGNKKRWSDKEQRKIYEEKLKLAREFANTDEVRNKISNTVKELWQNEEYRNRNMNAKHSSEKFNIDRHLKQKETNKSPETKLRRHNAGVEIWARPEYIDVWKEIRNSCEWQEQRSFNSKRMWLNDEIRMTITNAIIKRWEDPLYKENTSVKIRERMQDPAYIEKIISRGYSYKKFELPSGRIVNLQGYEPQVLTELLKSYDEHDISVGVKEIKNSIGCIKYVNNNKEHEYYPDFYIKSINTIIEVKSNWTFKLHEEVNLLKEQACKNNGFNFEFIILEKGERSAVATLAASKL